MIIKRLVMLIALTLGFILPIPTASGAPSTTITFDRIAAKPTEWGRQINDLHAFDGKIFAGYGDWNANGRINVQVYDPATGEVITGPQTGNAVHFMYDDGTTLYEVGPESGGVRVFQAGGDPSVDWTRLGCCTHEFGAVKHNGVLYVSGQDGKNDGTVVAYYPDGTQERILDGGTRSFRFHGIGVIGNTLWVFGQGDEWSMDLTTGEWTEHPNLVTWNMMYKATSFAGKIVGLYWYPTGSTNHARLYQFDGTGASYLTNGMDMAVEGDTLYILTGDGKIKSTTDLVTFKQEGKVNGGGRSTTGRSIAVLDGVVYVGKTEGKMVILDTTKGNKGNNNNG